MAKIYVVRTRTNYYEADTVKGSLRDGVNFIIHNGYENSDGDYDPDLDGKIDDHDPVEDPDNIEVLVIGLTGKVTVAQYKALVTLAGKYKARELVTVSFDVTGTFPRILSYRIPA